MALTEIDLNVQAKDHTLIPSKISNNPADNFTFPNNVIVSGQLQTPAITDLSAILVVDVTNRYLKDSSNVISMDWLNRLLKASDGSTSINFNTPGTVDVNTILDVTGQSIIHVADPVSANDAANKTYVDTVAQGLSTKASCAAATTTALVPVTPAGSGVGKTLTENANGLLSVDGVSTWVDVVNDGGSTNPAATNPASRVLVKNQANPIDNGIYCVTNKGSAGAPFVLTRAIDFDGSPANEVAPGDFTFIGAGTVNASSGWTVSGTNNPVVVDVNPIPFIQFSGAGQIIAGQGLTKTGNELDVHPLDASLLTHIGDISVQRDPAGAIGLSGSGVVANVDGTYIGISANALTLLNPTQHTVAGTNGQIQYNSSGSFAGTANITTDGTNIAMATGVLSVSAINTTGSDLALDVNNRTLHHSSSGQVGNGVTVDYQNMVLQDAFNQSAHPFTLNWSSMFLADRTTGNTSLNWFTRLLLDSAGAQNLSWNTPGVIAVTNQLTAVSEVLSGTDPNLALQFSTGGGITLTTPPLTVGPIGGSITLTTGSSHAGISQGGSLTLTTGTDSNVPTGGNITLTTGSSSHGNATGGSIILTTALTSGYNAQGGSITLTSGDLVGVGETTTGGSITLTSGNPGGSSSTAGGNITLTSFAPSNGGSLILTGTGANGTSGSPAHGNIYANNINSAVDMVAGGTVHTSNITADGTNTLTITTQFNTNTGDSPNMFINPGGIGTGLFSAGTLTLAGGPGVGGGQAASLILSGWNGNDHSLSPSNATLNCGGGDGTSPGNFIIKSGGSETARFTNGHALGIGTTTPHSTLETSGSVAELVTSVTTTLTSGSETVMLCDATSGAFTVTLPASAGVANRRYSIKKIDSSANAVTIQGNGAETIDGSNTISLNVQNKSYTLVNNGTSWFLI